MRLLNRITNKALTLYFKLFESKPKPTEPTAPNLVAKRFQQLFVDHGIEETQIPRVFSKITLDDLKSDESLLKKLTPDLINEVAELFKVRVEWIEGVDETIYSYWSCYKEPESFFKYLKTIKYEEYSFPFRLITTVQKFDYKDESYQPFCILFVEKIAKLGDERIYRYQLDTGWKWEHAPCREQIKAMAMLYWKQARHPITIHKVSKETYQQIEDLSLIPYHYLRGSLVSEPSLEDYVIEPSESMVSKEAEELPVVLKYIADNNLSEMKVFRSTVGNDNLNSLAEENQSDVNKVISEMNRKNAKSRYESLDKHKELFKDFFTANNYKNKSKAARDYFSSLSLDDKKIVVPTYYEQDHSNGLDKAVRTLTNYLKQ
jgi:hypothetical protein